ncbi:hypothetical protein WICMUC_004700 [Wickerhamomyces mucosus]|uniref:Pantoate--beta-alanine ligase n=1 Tax=Wickerhamomyces mucosus TaxID=1378264 RepID=A0A9P8T9I8_9ASCO|nr:hypothetical protein WICMUC_004700 [Wickerhamomyces mucosus]
MTDSIVIFRTVSEYRNWRNSLPNNTSIGFVPTMGALHQGHLSLVSQSLKENTFTVISIFVNPSQFAPNEDLNSYPRTFTQDLELLSNLNIEGKSVNAIFAPTVLEMYPSGIDLDINKQQGAFVSVLGVSEQLEGQTRPNFFRGVATVVTKLFNAIQPTVAYFGQKDIQQTIVLKRMVKDLLIPIEIKVLPIIRESNGLALSSRNAYLSDELRENSSLIYKALKEGESAFKNGKSRDEILSIITKILLKNEQFKIDYISLADKETLQEIDDLSNGAILSIAIYVTENERTTRLIDNIIL